MPIRTFTLREKAMPGQNLRTRQESYNFGAEDDRLAGVGFRDATGWTAEPAVHLGIRSTAKSFETISYLACIDSR
jgi:hypothetical protein